MNQWVGKGYSNISIGSAGDGANSADWPQMTEEDLRRIMSAAKAPGNDGIRLRNILANFDKVKYVLLKIINSSLSTGRIPCGLRLALVRPIF